jgi:pyruvate-ferredoxin/flavodoxin oxidoreductase
VDVVFGLGGLPLRSADLLALLDELPSSSRSLVYLGLDFVRGASAFPKQQALMDALRRADPELEAMGLRRGDAAPAPPAEGATTIAVHRSAGEHEALAGQVARLLHEVLGGHVRSRPALTVHRFDQPCRDVVVHAPRPLLDPGDDVAVDLAITALDAPRDDLSARLAENGAVLVIGGADAAPPPLPPGASAALHAVPPPPRETDRTEVLLGAVLRLVVDRSGVTPPSETQLRGAREADLGELDDAERGARIDAFVSGFESVRRVDAAPAADAGTGAGETAPAPPVGAIAAARTAHSPSRFWDHVGMFHRIGRTEELAADPALSTGAVPPLTSTFRDVSRARRVLPVFDAAACDGSPDLWMSDPDGAVAPIVISARALLESGIELATERGRAADGLRAVLPKVATRANTLMADEAPPATARALFEAALDDVLEKMDEGRRAAARPAMVAVLDEIGALPVARTPVFFDEPERRQRGTGELFSLVVNPDVCKSPEIVLAACAGRGLRAAPQTDDALADARRLWALWQRLPDTTGATIERVRPHPEVGTLAAIMLSRHCLHAMAGGDGAEAGSGARLALSRVLALAEFSRQPRLQQHLEEITALREKLGERIRATLAEALPTEDLEALGAGLDLLGREDVDLAALSARVDTVVSGGRVDGARLGRLVDAARGLADLEWHLAKGPEGLGRARLGLVIAPGAVATWAGTFPFNPFRCPTLVAAGEEPGHMARGLLEGHLRQALAGFRLARWARMELERPDEAAAGLETLAGLRGEDLTPDERQLVPPVLVVGDDQALDPRELVSLLSRDVPIKIVVLSDAGSAADGGIAVDSFGRFPGGRRFDLALLGLLTRRAFVVQTSVSRPDHLADGVLGAMAHDGPALVVVHAPSPQRHGFAIEQLHEQARLAVASRAFPLLRFDPAAGGVFGACLDLSGNPGLTARLGAADGGAPLTPVDWAATEARFAEHLAPLAGDEPEPTPIGAFLELEPADRVGKTPVVTVDRGEHEPQRLRVGAALVEDADARLRFWRTLQELSGVVTPFTAKVREDLERELLGAHEAELDRLRDEHETQLASRHREFQAEAVQRVTERLMMLAGRRTGGADDGEDGA